VVGDRSDKWQDSPFRRLRRCLSSSSISFHSPAPRLACRRTGIKGHDHDLAQRLRRARLAESRLLLATPRLRFVARWIPLLTERSAGSSARRCSLRLHASLSAKRSQTIVVPSRTPFVRRRRHGYAVTPRHGGAPTPESRSLRSGRAHPPRNISFDRILSRSLRSRPRPYGRKISAKPLGYAQARSIATSISGERALRSPAGTQSTGLRAKT